MMHGTHIPAEDLALYAMQALTPEESVRVRKHLTQCSECRAELSKASGDLALVALAVDRHPLPEGARRRFLNRIAEDASAAHVTLTPAAVPIDRSARNLPWPAVIAWAAVAALLVLAAGMEIRIRSLDRQLAQQAALLQSQNAASARAQAILDLLTSPAAQHVELTAAHARPAPAARTVYLASHGALLMQASNLDSLPPGKTYELWVIPVKGAPIPAGLFRPDPAGNASVVLPSIPVGVAPKAFGVTIERAAGSTTPTAPIVLAGTVPAAGE